MSFSSLGSMIYCILCTITYIISYLVPILRLLPCSGYTPMLYYSFPTYCFIMYCSFHILFSCYIFHSSLSYLYYRIRSCYMFPSCTFHILLSCTIHKLHIHLYVHILSIIYFVLSYTFITFLVFIYLFHINLYCTSCSCNCLLSSHSKAMLLISYHILCIYISYVYTFHFLLSSCLQIP